MPERVSTTAIRAIRHALWLQRMVRDAQALGARRRFGNQLSFFVFRSPALSIEGEDWESS